MSRDAISLARVVEMLSGYRLPFAREAALQSAIRQIFAPSGVRCEPEYDLGIGYGRIDFFIPESGIGIEAKVKGSPAEVAAQLHRYSQCPEIQSLVLISGRARLGALPPTMGGKPLHVVNTWRGGL